MTEQADVSLVPLQDNRILPNGVSVGLQPSGNYSCRQKSLSISRACSAEILGGRRQVELTGGEFRPSRLLYAGAVETGGNDVVRSACCKALTMTVR